MRGNCRATAESRELGLLASFGAGVRHVTQGAPVRSSFPRLRLEAWGVHSTGAAGSMDVSLLGCNVKS